MRGMEGDRLGKAIGEDKSGEVDNNGLGDACSNHEEKEEGRERHADGGIWGRVSNGGDSMTWVVAGGSYEEEKEDEKSDEEECRNHWGDGHVDGEHDVVDKEGEHCIME